jgi:hypothetical protein
MDFRQGASQGAEYRRKHRKEWHLVCDYDTPVRSAGDLVAGGVVRSKKNTGDKIAGATQEGNAG